MIYKKTEYHNMKTLKYSEFLNESFDATAHNGNDLGNYFIRLLAVRDQAHVFHWQTKSFARHEAFGNFYESFLTNVDALVEMIMGLKGRPIFGEGATISINDYSDVNISRFFENLEPIFSTELEYICSSDEHEELFDQARIIIADIDKLKYLLTLS